jgi:hypothetical protein
LLLAEHLALASSFTPAVRAYWERLRARPGYQAALAAQLSAAQAQGISSVPAPDLR